MEAIGLRGRPFDAVIADIATRQGRKSAHGERFSAKLVADLRRHRGIPRYEPPAEPPTSELVNIRKAAEILKLALIAGHAA